MTKPRQTLIGAHRIGREVYLVYIDQLGQRSARMALTRDYRQGLVEWTGTGTILGKNSR